MRWQAPDGALERIRASAGEPGGLPPEREQEIREGVLRRSIAEGLIPERDADSWARSLEGDLFGTIEVLNEMADARRSSGNGAVTAAAPRRDDAEQLIASAVKAGKFRAERADFWRRRFAENPQQTAALIEALTPVLASGGQRKTDEASAIGAIHPKAAARLGYAVQLPHPLRPGDMPGRVLKPPPEGRVHHAVDRS